MRGPEKELLGPESPGIPLLPGKMALAQGGLDRKGQQGQGKKKELAGRDPAQSLGSGHPAGGKPVVPTVSAGAGVRWAGREEAGNCNWEGGPRRIYTLFSW